MAIYDVCFSRLFNEQVELAPDAVSIVFEKTQLTYQELNHRANQLAHYLKALGIGPEVLVGVYMERSLVLSVAIIGILKAGGVCVPLDPADSYTRLSAIVENSQMAVLLTNNLSLANWGETFCQKTQIVRLSALWSILTQERIDTPVNKVTAQNLAFIFYTSGSTGRAKGVMLSHEAVCKSHLSEQSTQKSDVKDSVLLKSSVSFAGLIGELIRPLLNGSRVIVTKAIGQQDVRYLVRLIAEQQVTEINFVPSMLQVFLDEPDVETCSHLQSVSCSSEILPVKLQENFFTRITADLHYVYGSTETCAVASWKCDLGQDRKNIPIGRPTTMRLYVLDRHLKPVTAGSTGELYVAGNGLARGYLNNPALTAEKFLPDPFSHQPGTRLYKTGDLGRYGSDGNIEFIGRIDTQVKIRGFRVELGEIEMLLNQHPTVYQAAVLARKDRLGQKCLVAYVVPSQNSMFAPDTLRYYLKLKLPDYMIPSIFIKLNTLPLSANGKVNRQLLPISNSIRPYLSSVFVEPRTNIEQQIAKIWIRALNFEQIGIHDNFFELGGHSLLATQITSQICVTFQIELPLRNFLENPTIAGLAKYVEAGFQTVSDISVTYSSVPRLSTALRNNNLPLSYAQQRLWFLAQFKPNSSAYNIASVFCIKGKLNVNAIKLSLKEIVRRHEILRTRFVVVGGQPTQAISSESFSTVSQIDLRELPMLKREQEVTCLSGKEIQQPFNLEREPLLRIHLLQLQDEEYRLLISMHHIISDGWSMSIFFHELTIIYQAFCTGKPSPLPELPIQYAEFVYWQRKWLQGNILETQLAYWKQRLGGELPLLQLPTDYCRPPIQTEKGATQSFVVSPSLTQALKIVSRREKVTLFILMLTAFKALLYRYTEQQDILVGTPIANRSKAEFEDLIGLFANTIVIRTDLSGDPTFRELLKRVQGEAVGSFNHQDLPFEKLVEILKPGRDLSRNPLFQVMFAFQNFPTMELELPSLTLSSLSENNKTAKFDLTLFLSENGEKLAGSLEYKTDLFEHATISRLIEHFQTLLQGIISNLDQPLSKLPILTAAEQEQILCTWNNTKTNYPEHVCVHELFQAQVEKQLEAVAVVSVNQSLTYQQVNQQANQLAHYLRKLGVGPEVLVGICVERSIQMVIGLLAILKAGGAYVPLDPKYPAERQNFILEDAKIPVLLTQQRLLEHIPYFGTHIVCLDNDWDIIAKESTQNLFRLSRPDNLVYVIYTSGSTGKPKGVQITHRSVVALINWAQATFNSETFARTVASTSICFDLSVFELFVPLICGGKILLVENALTSSLSGVAEQPNLLNIVPSAAAELVRIGKIPASVHTVNLAGEPLQSTLVQQLYRQSTIQRVFNLYGPSEDTTYTTFALLEKGSSSPPHIGRPIANTQIYLLDSSLQPVPVGVPGELYIGGDGLARGYLNNPRLTAEKFIPNPFNHQLGARLYKTGDLARYRSDGNIEFVGRIDQQVKVRGFRIELGEIEAVLNKHIAVQSAIVSTQINHLGDSNLVAYVVFNKELVSAANQLRSFLKERLPEYMVPSFFVELETLPLTPNGKIDRRALPPYSKAYSAMTRKFVAPRNAVELQLLQIWKNLLEVHSISVTDNFFDIGGHSLLAVRLLAQIQKQFGQNLKLSSFFQNATIEHLSSVLRKQTNSLNESLIVSIRKSGTRPPFFCIHPIGGTIFCYNDLSRYLSEEQPFYGIQSAGLCEEHKPDSTVEDMATHYVEALRSIQPQGPYILGGWSFGGILAFEMAQQLQKQQNKVAMLVMFDSRPPIYDSGSVEANQANLVFELTKDLQSLFGQNVNISLAELLLLKADEQLNYVLRRIKEANVLPLDTELSQMRYLLQVYKANTQAMHSYVPQVYPGRMLFFRAKERAADASHDFAIGWSKFVSGDFEVHCTPGNHYTMIREPHVQALASMIEFYLGKVLSEET